MNEPRERRRSGPYRSRHGMIFGVCRGLAEHLDFSVFWMRIITLGLFLFTGIWPIGVLYLAAAIMMPLEPVVPFQNEADEEFYKSYTSSRQMALHRLQRTFERLDRRIRRMEDIVTGKDYDWDQRLNGRAR